MQRGYVTDTYKDGRAFQNGRRDTAQARRRRDEAVDSRSAALMHDVNWMFETAAKKIQVTNGQAVADDQRASCRQGLRQGMDNGRLGKRVAFIGCGRGSVSEVG